MDDQTTLVILVFVVGGIGLVVGGAIGAILMSAFGGQSGSSPNAKNLSEVLRVWRNKANNNLALEVSGKLYEKPDDLPEKSRQGLALVTQDLSVWAGIPPVAVLKPAASAAAAAAPTQAQSALRTTSPAQLAAAAASADLLVESLRADAAASPGPAGALETPPAAGSAGQPASAGSSDTVRVAAVEAEKVKVAPPAILSLAAQIDEIVQERLPGSPLNGRLIKVREVPPHAVKVVVDNQQFDGVGDVTDPEVQKFLRECVAEWERRGG